MGCAHEPWLLHLHLHLKVYGDDNQQFWQCQKVQLAMRRITSGETLDTLVAPVIIALDWGGKINVLRTSNVLLEPGKTTLIHHIVPLYDAGFERRRA